MKGKDEMSIKISTETVKYNNDGTLREGKMK